MLNKRNYHSNLEIQVASSEVFLDAVNFFSKAGVKFINKKRDHRYGLSILIDDSLKRPVIITPFRYAMSRNALAYLYVEMIKGERFGGARRIQSLIRVINNLIKDGYRRGSMLSFNIETGKNRLRSFEVLSIFFNIAERALTYSIGGEIEHLGDVYSLLGGETGTYHFFKEVLIATEASIPELDDVCDKPIIGHISDIKCYTCKYCKCDKDGVRTCTKVATYVDPKKYGEDPNHYGDAHHSDDCEGLVSTVIDSRMDTCDNYVPRI